MAQIPEFMVLYAVRYALGRKSHSVSEVTGWLEENWDQISGSTKTSIYVSIRRQERFDMPEKDYDPLGDPCDRKRWEELRDRIADELNIDEQNRGPVKEAQ